MSNTPKLVLLFAAIGLIGALVLVLTVGRTTNLPTDSEINLLEGCEGQDNPSLSSSEYSRTVFGSSGAVGNLYLTPNDFARFSLAIPCYVSYQSDLELREMKALLRPDGIPSIDTPRYESAREGDQWLEDDDIVLSLAFEGVVRAYPTRIMNWHEIVNDSLGDVPITITFCPLCNSGLVFVRPEINGQHPEFGTSGRIYKSDLVMYDRATLTLWSQLEGGPIMGQLVGKVERLDQIPAGMTTWGFWKEAHPETEVLARPTTDLRIGGEPATAVSGQGRLYQRNYNLNPYQAYLTDNGDTFGTSFSDRRLPAKADVVGVRISDTLAKAYLKEAVEEVGLINDQLGDLSMLVLWDAESQDVIFFEREMNGQIIEFELNGNGQIIDQETSSLWNKSGTATEGPMANEGISLKPVVGITTFWFAWFNFHPHTELYAES